MPLKARALKERWEHLATKVLFQMPKFAILDETTSALDMANESKCMLVPALGVRPGLSGPSRKESIPSRSSREGGSEGCATISV